MRQPERLSRFKKAAGALGRHPGAGFGDPLQAESLFRINAFCHHFLGLLRVPPPQQNAGVADVESRLPEILPLRKIRIGDVGRFQLIFDFPADADKTQTQHLGVVPNRMIFNPAVGPVRGAGRSDGGPGTVAHHIFGIDFTDLKIRLSRGGPGLHRPAHLFHLAVGDPQFADPL